uniref:DUF7746 domain-containing protein n=1 Tax=Vitis vinifera TaxID=29760 RepID=A5CBL1_VITVI|nr:hypothetical protein VITISV_023698 [Vitis vinifera]
MGEGKKALKKLFARELTWKSTDSQDVVVNSEEINYPKIQNDLDDWKLPKCFPNFTVRLRDADILDSVVLHVKTHDFKFKFAYKSMTTSVGSGALCTSPKDETTFFRSDMINKFNFIVPMKIKWNEVEFPENWHFANAVSAIEQRSEMIEQIVQYSDGGGDLIFSNSFRHSSSPRILYYEPSRASSSSIPVRTTRIEEGSSSANPKNIKLTSVRSHTNVGKPFYTEENESTQESYQDESPDVSPTYSQMINTVSLSDEEFEEIIETQDHIKTTFVKKDNKPLFKPFEFSKKFLKNSHIDQAFVDRISQTIKDNLVVLKTPQPSHWKINMVKGEISSEAEADELIKIFKEPPNQTVMRIINNQEPPRTRNYYPRPTFPDMQYEERNQYTQASYTSGTIYEWNIDGMTEYNILTKLQEMTMLKGWWDNYLTFEDRNGILKAYRINEENEVVKDEDGQDIEDVVATLIYSISKHFIGDPAKIKDKTADLLTNLKCPKLHDFRWIDSDNEDDINQLDSSGEEISSQTSSDPEECIKGNCDCQPRTINVLSQDEEHVLDVLRKVEDEKTKQDLYEVFKKSVGKQEVKRTVNPYSLNEILIRFNQQSTKDVTIKDLQEQVELEEEAMLHSSDHMPNKMLSLYYDPSDPSKPVKATQCPTITGSQTFKQVTKANPFQNELTSSSSFSNKQIVVAANPKPLSTKSRYWQKDLNQPLLVIEREFFSENPGEIVAKAFHESFHYPSGDLLKTREFYEAILVETGFVKIKHNADKFSNLDLAFSICHIYKILTVKQWGGNPNFSREFSKPSKPRFFNYWDYQIAWFNAFLIQNKDFHH